MGSAGSSTTLSTAPGVEQSRATYCLATFVAASSALALSQPMPTRPLLAWALIAASVSAGVGAGAACGAVGAGVAPADGLVAVPVAVGLGVAVAARSASGTTPFCAVADVEGVAVVLAFGVDFEVAAPEGVAVPLGVPVEVPLGAAWLALASSAWTYTARKRSCDGFFSASSCSGVGCPGIETTMLRPPCVVISASETPLASMRWRMMSTARLTWPSEIVSVPVSCGWSTSSVPPSRSRPRRGVGEPPPHLARPPARTARPRMTTMRARRLRLADFLVELRATKPSLTVLLGVRGASRCVGRDVGGCCGARDVAGRGIGLLHGDGATVEADGGAFGDLQPGAAVVQVLDGAVHARRGDDPVADGECRAEVPHLLHPLVLGKEQPAQQQQGQRENQQREGPVVVHVSSVLRVIVRSSHLRATTRWCGSDVASTTGRTGWCRGSGGGARRSLRARPRFVRPRGPVSTLARVTFRPHFAAPASRASGVEAAAPGLVERQGGGPEGL